MRWMTWQAMSGRAESARLIVRSRFTPETRVTSALDDAAGSIPQALHRGEPALRRVQRHGGVLHVQTRVNSARFQSLKLKHDKLLSILTNCCLFCLCPHFDWFVSFCKLFVV